MRIALLTAAAVVALAATGASAQTTVYNTSLPNVSGTAGTAGQNGVVTPSTVTTTTDATGTRTSVSANPGAANTGANRASATPTVGSWYQTNVGMGTTVGITTDYARNGNGSAYFNQTQAQNGKADLQYNIGSGGVLAPIALSALTSFSYDYLRGASSTTTGYFTPVLRLGILKDGQDAGYLIFERAYNEGLGAVPADTWLTGAGDLATGNFWNNSGALGPANATTGGTKSLADWIAGNTGSVLSVYAVQVGFGSGWSDAFTGAVDNISVQFGNLGGVSANFEVAAATPGVPEPATWGMMILGLGGAGFAMRRRGKATLAAA